MFLTFSLPGCGQIDKWYYCGYGHKNAENKNYETAIRLLDNCLELGSLLPKQQVFYLQTRAWAHFSLDNYSKALQDQEKSFKLIPPTTHREFINHAAYLRMVGRSLESLEPLLKAEVLDERDGRHPSMMTQYNLGWSLYEIGRYDEAIAAFTKGIPSQPDYPFVYFRRGLAYDKIDQVKKAESDFAEFVTFFEIEDSVFNERFSNELKEMSLKYSELKILLKEAN